MSSGSGKPVSRTDWQRVKNMRDEDIVFDEDSPATRPEDWEDAVIRKAGKEIGRVRLRGQRGPQKTPTKQQVSLRLDPKVVAYFKSQGPGWQTRINQALRELVERRR